MKVKKAQTQLQEKKINKIIAAKILIQTKNTLKLKKVQALNIMRRRTQMIVPTTKLKKRKKRK